MHLGCCTVVMKSPGRSTTTAGSNHQLRAPSKSGLLATPQTPFLFYFLVFIESRRNEERGWPPIDYMDYSRRELHQKLTTQYEASQRAGRVVRDEAGGRVRGRHTGRREGWHVTLLKEPGAAHANQLSSEKRYTKIHKRPAGPRKPQTNNNKR